MKKIFILLTGIICLASCHITTSEEPVKETEQAINAYGVMTVLTSGFSKEDVHVKAVLKQNHQMDLYMFDIKFASATAEGEYRAKAAKLKLPMNNKRGKFNNSNNIQQEVKQEPIVVQEEKLEVVQNPSLEAQNEVQEIKEEKELKKKGSRKPKFDKKKVKQ